MLLLKNTQFLPNHCETLSKRVTHEYLILTQFCYDWIEIQDVFYKSIFLGQSSFLLPSVYIRVTLDMENHKPTTSFHFTENPAKNEF